MKHMLSQLYQVVFGHFRDNEEKKKNRSFEAKQNWIWILAQLSDLT
jgi:hypothetical protein